MPAQRATSLRVLSGRNEPACRDRAGLLMRHVTIHGWARGPRAGLLMRHVTIHGWGTRTPHAGLLHHAPPAA